SQVLGDLLDQIPQDERVDSVYTDGAYDTKQCRKVIADRQAHAVIPPRKNAKPWKDKKMSSLERNELLRTVKRLGRTIWKKWSGYSQTTLLFIQDSKKTRNNSSTESINHSLRLRLTHAHICSIGFKSGLYAGSQRILCPCCSNNS
ncbi:transposase, partial [Acinetobacter baumannii]